MKRKTTRRAVILALPFALSIYGIYMLLVFFVKSLKVLKSPAFYVLVVSTFLTHSAVAEAPKTDATHPYIISKPVIHIQTPKEYVMSLPHGDIVWRIYGNESSFGQNTFLYCKKRGLINDVGYNVLGNPPTCFSSFKEEMQTISQWFDKQLQTKTLAQSLCYYNMGKVENNCRYAQDFLGL